MNLVKFKKNGYFLKNLSFIFVVILFLNLAINLYGEAENRERFTNLEKIKYNISFNGISSGYITWEYLGKESIEGNEVDVLSVESDTNILKFLDLVSSEKIYLDSKTHLPIRVERNIKLFGDQEIIEENYDQTKGQVIITRKKGKDLLEEEIYKQDIPIHNILDLLYFFPQEIDLGKQKGKWMAFNLPNQKVQIRFDGMRKIKVAGSNQQAYFLVGKGARRFNLWLSLEKKIPLRLDFISWLGKVIIRREEVKRTNDR